jgi:hypothetical protein
MLDASYQQFKSAVPVASKQSSHVTLLKHITREAAPEHTHQLPPPAGKSAVFPESAAGASSAGVVAVKRCCNVENAAGECVLQQQDSLRYHR